MGPQSSQENSQDVVFGPVDPKCCSCPRRARLLRDAQGCFYFTFLLRRRVAVSDECCALSHVEARDHRQSVRDDNDPAADAYHAVRGRGFFRGWETEGSNTGRSLLTSDVTLCATARVNVREAPSTSAGVVLVLAVGQPVQTTGTQQRGFSEVTTADGKRGWASSAFLANCPRATGSAPVAAAESARPAAAAPTAQNGATATTSQVNASNGLCPLFYKIWEGYPPHSVETPDLLERLGFCKHAETNCWVTNSCTIRLTLALNSANLDPGRIGPTKWLSKGRRFMIRVEEGVRFVPAVFGRSYARGGQGTQSTRTDEQGNAVYSAPAGIVGKAGIIHFWNCGWSDATGHWEHVGWTQHSQSRVLFEMPER